ncbi:uncharacterized protein NMK_0145 [Novimethylophilus kurashikiensis]|uniref:Diguanylate cyclase n=1 Tax=Novimethylophilus kurashikiensis TaxID=1825523 RepID=A0A2R5F7J8_9PROT|nr:sensor domain-containing diguanylate cyclase [Novimethylophilus kurashikiensis]GBG12614.1 uncharacterized protein NMK_0145 [Novimethylophilus kurashikiensis]
MAFMPSVTTINTNWLYALLIASTVLAFIASIAAMRFLRLSRALRESEERWKFALEGAGDGVWDWNVQTDEVVFSRRYKDMYGFTDNDIEAGDEAWKQRIHPDDRERVAEDVRDCLAGKTVSYVNEHRVCCKDGSIKWVLARGMIVSRDANGTPLRMIGTHTDITLRKSAEDQTRHLAHYDALTELPNRTLINDRLQQAIVKAKRDKNRMAVMFVDLDQFKPVNDNLGHDIGDLLLKQVARRLQSCMRESDTVARIGGDEFVVLLPEIDREADAEVVAAKIRNALQLPFEAAGHYLSISCSTGIAVYPDHGLDEKLLLINADIAMYRAKKAGKNNYQFYSGEFQEKLEPTLP